MFDKVKFVTNRIPRRNSLDFIKKHTSRKQAASVVDDETSECSSSASTLVPTPLPLLATEQPRQEHVNLHATDAAPQPVHPILSARQANQFLEQVQSAIYEYQNRIGVLNQSIRQQTGIAKGRYVHGNGTGACLAMKKAKKLERERNLTIQAMDLALDAAVEIQMALHRAASRAATDDCTFHVDIGASPAQVLFQTHRLLHAKHAEWRMGRQQLLDLVHELL